MSPIARAEGHDAPRLVDEPVPGVAAVVDDGLAGREDPVREPVVAHELPDVLHHVELGALRRQRDRCDVRRHRPTLADMCQPAWSSSSTACAPGATPAAISARCGSIAAVRQCGSTSAAPLPPLGQTAPKM